MAADLTGPTPSADQADDVDGRPIRTAVIGYGLAGSVFHAPLIDAVEGLELTAVVTSNVERAEAARVRYPGVRVYANAQELWVDAHELDLVVVAAPNNAHAPLALTAIEAGLAVVIDKPLAVSAADGERVRVAASIAGVLASVFQNRRWDGDALTLRALLADGSLGDVHRFESRFERWRPQVNTGAWREGADPAAAGGLLFDLGSHLIDQALNFFGPVTRVYAEVRPVRPAAQVDDDVFVALTHAGGVVSHLWASATAADLGPRFRVLGAKGSYIKYGLDVQEAALRAGGGPRDADWGAEGEASWGRLGTPGVTRAVPTLAGRYEAFYEGIRDSLLTGVAPPVLLAEAIAVLRVIEAARASAGDRTVVTL